MDLKSKILTFLYEQVSLGKIPQIRKGMVEDFEQFVTSILSEREISRSTKRMMDTKALEEEDVEKDSK